MLTKDALKKKFAKEWEKYYKIDFLIEKGFKRKICSKCGKGFWTLDSSKETCSDQPCSFYEFIDNPPTKKKFDYIEAWKTTEDFFKKNNHTSVRRYPVICRWRPDLFFTDASIIDFQRVEGDNVVFQMPANPLIVPQMSLRFNDIPNVGRTGKHYTAFCMIGQHSIFDGKEGYWKDKCIELDYKLLTGPFEIKPEEVVFVESLWLGAGAFGSSMEYFVRGLELGNAVFTEFLETPNGIKEMEYKVIDMGAGLERFAWISHGTPTSYDIVFEPVLRFLKKQTGIKYDIEFFSKYSKLAGTLDFDEVRDLKRMKEVIANKLSVTPDILETKVKPLEALYAICDHTRALTFAISDGMLPSNVGGGYNLRVILRRALGFIDDNRWNIDLGELCSLHARQLRSIYPELSEHLDDINEILQVERKRFGNTKKRTQRIVETIAQRQETIDEQKLIQLYDSEGITPELVKDYIPVEMPEDFYVKVTERHLKEKPKPSLEMIDVSGLPPTELIFYDKPEKMEFDASVLKMIDNKWLVLDKTCFYPEGGGQKPDVGFIGDSPVTDVQKIGDVVVHRVTGNFEQGQFVNGRVNSYSRESMMRHHTATHIINTACRQILGNWVWQHSAEKTTKKARLDITHYESLTDDQIEKIEEKANEIVNKNIPVKKELLPREEAEKKYGFRIYQGGVVPEKTLKIISIGNIDHEACGGIHVDNTNEVGFITIMKTKRVQDGVVRIEFCSGDVALKYLKEKESIIKEASKLLKAKEEKLPEKVKELFGEWKEKRKQVKKEKKKFEN